MSNNQPPFPKWEYARDESNGGSVEWGNFRKYKATVRVKMDELTSSKQVIDYLISEGFTPFKQYDVAGDVDPFAFLKTIGDPVRVGGTDCSIWEVPLEFEPLQFKRRDENGNPTDDPTLFLPEMSISHASTTETETRGYYLGDTSALKAGVEGFNAWSDTDPQGNPVGFDWPQIAADGNKVLITNSVGFQRKVQKQRSTLILTIKRNFAYVIFEEGGALPQDWINDADVTLTVRQTQFKAKKHTLRCLSWQTSPKIAKLESVEEPLDYVEVVCRLAYDPERWNAKLLNEGTKSRGTGGDINTADGTVIQQTLDGGVQDIHSGGQKVNREFPLDKDGIPLEISGNDAAWGEWRYYDELDMENIDFFTPIIGNKTVT